MTSLPPPLAALLDALEACWLDPTDAEVSAVAENMTERQKHLDRLQAFDTLGLCPKAAAELAVRLRAVLERDTQLAEKTDEWRKTLMQEGERMRTSRRSATGYRRVVDGIRAALDRIA